MLVAGDFFIHEPAIAVVNESSSGGDFSFRSQIAAASNDVSSGGNFAMKASVSSLQANHAPTAMPDFFARPAADDLKIQIQKLLLNDFDADADTLSIQLPTESNAGATISVSNGWVFYNRVSNEPDFFEYAVTDQYGAISRGRVEIAIADPDSQSTIRLQIAVDGAGAHIRFAGIQTRAYIVQRTASLEEPWADLAIAANLGLGRFGFDDAAGAASYFYRVVYRP